MPSGLSTYVFSPAWARDRLCVLLFISATYWRHHHRHVANGGLVPDVPAHAKHSCSLTDPQTSPSKSLVFFLARGRACRISGSLHRQLKSRVSPCPLAEVSAGCCFVSAALGSGAVPVGGASGPLAGTGHGEQLVQKHREANGRLSNNVVMSLEVGIIFK